MASFSRNGVNVSDNTTLLLVGGGLAIIYFGVVKPALDAGKSVAEMLNLKDTEQEKKEQKAAAQNATANGWNPQYYKNLQAAKKSVLIMTQVTAIAMSRDIFEAMGFFNDDEEKVYGTLRKIKSQAHLSYLADVFYSQHRQGLYDFIKKSFNTAELATVASILQPLPNYIPAK